MTTKSSFQSLAEKTTLEIKYFLEKTNMRSAIERLIEEASSRFAKADYDALLASYGALQDIAAGRNYYRFEIWDQASNFGDILKKLFPTQGSSIVHDFQVRSADAKNSYRDSLEKVKTARAIDQLLPRLRSFWADNQSDIRAAMKTPGVIANLQGDRSKWNKMQTILIEYMERLSQDEGNRDLFYAAYDPPPIFQYGDLLQELNNAAKRETAQYGPLEAAINSSWGGDVSHLVDNLRKCREFIASGQSPAR